jgi:hypothetical protein
MLCHERNSRYPDVGGCAVTQQFGGQGCEPVKVECMQKLVARLLRMITMHVDERISECRAGCVNQLRAALLA